MQIFCSSGFPFQNSNRTSIEGSRAPFKLPQFVNLVNFESIEGERTEQIYHHFENVIYSQFVGMIRPPPILSFADRLKLHTGWRRPKT